MGWASFGEVAQQSDTILATMTTTPETPETQETPEYIPDPWSQSVLHMFKWLGKAAAWLFGLGIAIALALNGYDQLDLNGYIHHDRTLDVYMSNDWLVGENRVCSLILRTDANGKPTGQLDSLICSIDSTEKHAPHNVSVTFKGIVDHKNIGGDEQSIPDEWKCTRGSNDFTCEAMAAVPAKPSTP